MISLDRCDGSCNTFDDPSVRINVNLNLIAFNMITKTKNQNH